MPDFPQDRIRGSLWGRGRAGIVAGAVVIALLLYWVPAIRWFLGISVVLGLAMAALIGWWNTRRPVKDPEEEKIVLHLTTPAEAAQELAKQNEKEPPMGQTGGA